MIAGTENERAPTTQQQRAQAREHVYWVLMLMSYSLQSQRCDLPAHVSPESTLLRFGSSNRVHAQTAAKTSRCSRKLVSTWRSSLSSRPYIVEMAVFSGCGSLRYFLPSFVHRRNASVAQLYEDAITYEGAVISSSGALINFSGKKTGRSPKDKRIVYEDSSKDDIWWGPVNIKMGKL